MQGLKNMSVREMEEGEARYVVDYFHKADSEFLLGMGADPNKLPDRDDWIRTIQSQVIQPYNRKDRFYVIWLWKGKPIGHCNVNQILFGESARMHLHMWDGRNRKRGLGENYLKLAIPIFFDRLELNELWCEPYAHNPSPNKTLLKLGFEFIDTVITVPGSINLEQEVNRYRFLKRNVPDLKVKP